MPETEPLSPLQLLSLEDTFTDDLDRGEHRAKYGCECSENDVSDDPISLAESELRNVCMELLCEDDMTVASNRWTTTRRQNVSAARGVAVAVAAASVGTTRVDCIVVADSPRIMIIILLLLLLLLLISYARAVFRISNACNVPRKNP